MIVVTDTSVVLNLCWLRHEGLLSEIYQQVLAPSQVRSEFERKTAIDPRFTGLRFPHFVAVADAHLIPELLTQNADLDPGEVAALALALERGIGDVLIDEQAARAAAIALGLRVSGLFAVLIEGKRRGRIERVGPLLDALSNGAKFWIDSRLHQRVLRAAGELP